MWPDIISDLPGQARLSGVLTRVEDDYHLQDVMVVMVVLYSGHTATLTTLNDKTFVTHTTPDWIRILMPAFSTLYSLHGL